ncbi:LAMI_0F16028g1_1 [Lachancea mirantina]|uniref:LAMI_0F16028g1_1 n=1 Tax=Lachancea mirantina TaxID=1230905 RepID=A0A1G4K4S1_9SACH|nr:LAMI_0F16028g1_1 [Lachancea mirantina]
MSNVQNQDLRVFSDHSVLSKHLFKSSFKHHLILVTHKNGTSPSWLINALVETHIFGAPVYLNESQRSVWDKHAANDGEKAISVASFYHDADYFTSAFAKLKLDPSRYRVLDFLTNFAVRSDEKSSDQLLQEIIDAVGQSGTDTVILEQPELLMPLLDLGSDELHFKLISPLARKVSLLIIVMNTEGYEHNDIAEYQRRDATELTRFAMACFHKSTAVLGLKPLESGRADDVTGILRVSRGPALAKSFPVHVVENEYLFLTKKGSTKLFYR